MDAVLDFFRDWASGDLTGTHGVDWFAFISIPFFTGIIGWLINWSGLWMLFSPVKFYGFKVPGLREVATVIPRKLQEVPGIPFGRIGWQGIVPARAAKMGSIAVDKVIAKLGTPAEFYAQLEPEEIAAHIVKVFEPDLPQMVDDIMMREHPRLWRDLPPALKQGVIARVQAQLPGVVTTITDEIGVHINQLLDPKIMVIDHFRKNPDLVVRVFRDVGQTRAQPDGAVRLHLRLPARHPGRDRRPDLAHLVAAAAPRGDRRMDHQRARHVADLRAAGAPADPRHQGAGPVPAPPGRVRRGLRRDHRRRRGHAGADRRLPHGRSARRPHPADDRDRDAAGDRQGGRPAPGCGQGRRRAPRRFDRIRESFAMEAVGRTITPFRDPAFSKRQSEKIRVLIARRTKELPPKDFVEMMRSAIKEDEWMLYAHGAVMGAAGGFIHLGLFNWGWIPGFPP